MENIIQMNNVVKYFDQVHPKGLFGREKNRIYALDGVSLALEKGEMCAYAGPNGAGKSTTFKLLCGMLKPQSGEIRAFGADPAAARIAMMRRTGVLFGNRSELWWDHPVSSSFKWKKKVWEIDDDVYNENVGLLTELMGLGEFWDSFARELSLGQRMRANLALTLLHSPELVLLDEPTLGLDVLAKRQMIGFLKTINAEKGVTMLITSHDMDDLTEMARRIVLINKGKLAFDGNLDALIRKTGDRRIIRISVEGVRPVLPGATLISDEDGRLTYSYDAGEYPAQTMFEALSKINGAADIEMSRAPIESVIAALFEKWQREGNEE